MNNAQHRKQDRIPHGFTLIEVVMVLLLFAILAVTMMANIEPSQDYLSSAVNTFRSNLRYAQSLGMSQSRLIDVDPADNMVVWGLAWNGRSYSLQLQGAKQNYIKLPGSSSASITLPGNTQFTSASNLYFNYRGQPVSSDGTVKTGDVQIKLKEGSITQTVTVVADTGFVQ